MSGRYEGEEVNVKNGQPAEKEVNREGKSQGSLAVKPGNGLAFDYKKRSVY